MCKLTEHSMDRMKERCGIGKSSYDKLAKTALEKGITRDRTTGSLGRYLDKLYLSRETANNIRIWGDKIFMFHNDVLITVLQLPPKYMKICTIIKNKDVV